MVRITNGVNEFEVTKGAYTSIYSYQGYTLVDDKHPAEDTSGTNEENGKTADDLFCEELMEKPLSQWNKDEVKRFAAIMDIDISGTKNAGEAKELIKAYLDANGQQ